MVGYGSGGLAVIDPAKASLLSRIPLPAHPEGFQLDHANRRAFVNVPDARQIAVVDMNAGRQTASWRLPDLGANFPMALDAAQAAVAVVFRNPARLVIFDVNTGKPTGTFKTCGDADDVFFDAKRRRRNSAIPNALYVMFLWLSSSYCEGDRLTVGRRVQGGRIAAAAIERSK